MEAARIGDIAAEHRIALHELSPQNASLEAAFMELTRDSVDYHAGGADTNSSGERVPALTAKGSN
jgi:ABC-2 type transport system ATP-binding protein